MRHPLYLDNDGAKTIEPLCKSFSRESGDDERIIPLALAICGTEQDKGTD
ncbi:unnamed protein product [Periconia digitata]|uniref:Uncharacterized protein n=1 Tax=Periconia digitata TaxID=1303443 RepID=A0A9W4XN01_9PLEO|nr:unnamed protein product [Periconia digitata]